MTIRIEWDDDGLRKLMGEVAATLKQNLERDLNALSGSMSGQALDTIRPAVRQAYERNGATISDAEVDLRAQDVQGGKQIVVHVR